MFGPSQKDLKNMAYLGGMLIGVAILGAFVVGVVLGSLF